MAARTIDFRKRDPLVMAIHDALDALAAPVSTAGWQEPTDPTFSNWIVSKCTWSQDEDGNYRTDCGHDFVFMDGDPMGEWFKFCCYCGKAAIPKPHEPVFNDNDNLPLTAEKDQ